MPATSVRYRYKAATSEGRVVEGELRAASRQVAIDELRRQQLFPVAVAEVAVARARAPRLGRRAAVALWARTAGVLLGAGIPLDRVLAFTAAQAGHPGLEEGLRQVRRQVQNGVSLADALAAQRQWFPPLVVAMIGAGEASGALDVVFDRLAAHLEEEGELRAQVRSALLYPVLMSIVATIGVLVLLLFVVPRFTAILDDVGGKLPASTRALLGLSSFLAGWWWLILALALSGAYGLRVAMRSAETRREWHRRRLTLPVIGDLELRYATAQFTRTLGLLLQSGAPMITALRVARAAVANLAMGAGIDRAAAEVSEGGALSPA
ncbi:MAG TPA: type II secretion system F family protein, partial [Gemmatimonadaceae bacterium]|nr:type II secretion system F family protein [Gemmatimonadaceae bacterium]